MPASPVPPAIPTHDITGLILAGGRGSRMGGVDKGLQPHQGRPLAQHVLQRLAPQVGRLMVNANRNRAAYEALGVPVWPDALPDYPGPLAGFLAGLERCETDWLVTVPCDAPRFPHDLVERLARAAVAANAELALPVTVDDDDRPWLQPAFCLLHVSLMESLVVFTRSGQAKIERWTALHRRVEVPFDEADAFFNANTLADLQHLHRLDGDPPT